MAWTRLGWYFVTPAVVLLSNPAFAQVFEPPGQGAPNQTTGGGRRNDTTLCQSASASTLPAQPMSSKSPVAKLPEQFLTALIPSSNVGLTFSEHPTFFFYVPKTSATTAEFKLDRGENQQIARIVVPLKDTPGVYRVTLPKTAAPLELDKPYFWAFSIACEQGGGANDPLVRGRVQRVQPSADLTNKLKAGSALDQVSIYASAGIWYEAMTALADLRQTQPNDQKVLTAWETLLGSVDLKSIAKIPLK